MEAAAETWLAGLRHRKLFVEDAATGAAARAYFAERGWETTCDVMMARTGPPPAPERAHAIEEVPIAGTRALRGEWYGPAEVQHVIDAEPYAARRDMRALLAPGKGFAWFVVAEDAIELDQLYVTESARGEGLGQALIAAALAAGGRELAWVVADDEGLAKALYARNGFAPAWRFHAFTRRPS
jgi:GNAT superfamily N-acetyltransferase